jgi:transposase
MQAKDINPDLILDLLKKNLSTKEIAIALGISSPTVCYWKKKLGLETIQKKINWTDVQALHNAGMSFRQISKTIGISVGAIEKARDRGDFKTVLKPPLTKEEKQARKREAYARWRSRLINQTPLNEDRQALREFYKNCPKGYEVDHIMPLSKGGLHTLSNLQYLTSSDNRRKKDKINWKSSDNKLI